MIRSIINIIILRNVTKYYTTLLLMMLERFNWRTNIIIIIWFILVVFINIINFVFHILILFSSDLSQMNYWAGIDRTTPSGYYFIHLD